MLRRFTNLFRRKKKKSSKTISSSSSNYDRITAYSEQAGTPLSRSVQQVNDSREQHQQKAPVTCVIPVGQSRCLSGGKDGQLSLVDFQQNRVVQKWVRHEKEVTAVAYQSATEIYLSGSRDKTINVFRQIYNEPNSVQQCVGHELVVTGLAVSQAELLVCSGSRDNSVRLWSAETGTCLHTSTLAQNLVTHICWAGNRNVVAQSSEDKMIHIWDIRNSLRPVANSVAKQYIQTWCDFSPDETYCLSSSNGVNGHGCEATLWDMRALRRPVAEYCGHSHSVTSCGFLRAQPLLVVTCSRDQTVRLWQQNTAACLSVHSSPESGVLTSCSVNADDLVLVSTTESGIAMLSVDKNNDQLISRGFI